jgi:drug/metabolite transporter (DMT)-like permease
VSLKAFGVLLALGAVWGASFMFIKVGGKEIEPFALVEFRLAIAAVILLGVAVARKGTLAQMRQLWRPLTMMGFINCALPYVLITWSEVYISSGLAAIYNATTPLWGAAILLSIPSAPERPTPIKIVGLLLGLAGVVLVVGSTLGTPVEDGVMNWVGQGAALIAALSYAISGIYGRRVLGQVPVQVSATGQLVTGALMLLPIAAFQFPTQVPSWEATGSVIALAVAGTALASLMYYWLLRQIGATNTLLVTYLIPIFALVWGALLLSEAFTILTLVGLALVLSGIGVTSGRGEVLLRRLVRREA